HERQRLLHQLRTKLPQLLTFDYPLLEGEHMHGLALEGRVLSAAYAYLRATHPFCRWRLPEPHEVKFHVARSKSWQGQCYVQGDRYGVDISSALVGQSVTLIAVMAHEMVHLAQKIAGTESRGSHNAEFCRRAAKVCRVHGFDPRTF